MYDKKIIIQSMKLDGRCTMLALESRCSSDMLGVRSSDIPSNAKSLKNKQDNKMLSVHILFNYKYTNCYFNFNSFLL